MGLLATAERSDRWAADPETLPLLSFELGRPGSRQWSGGWGSFPERLPTNGLSSLPTLGVQLRGVQAVRLDRNHAPCEVAIADDPPEPLFGDEHAGGDPVQSSTRSRTTSLADMGSGALRAR